MNVPRHRSAARVPRRRQWGGTLLGVFIGLVLGIALAASVGLYVTGGWRAYQQQIAGNRDARDVREPVKTAKADADRPRFDFYKILPGGEDPKSAAKPAPPDRAVADKAAGRAAPEQPTIDKGKTGEAVASVDQGAKTPVPERFWLQAGSFTTESDAENLRARLAMAGWEAQMQQGQLPDKATRYRVRLGPYDNVTELNRVKGELARRGFDVAVIRY